MLPPPALARFYAWSGRGYFVNYLQFGMRTPWIEEKPLVRALARHEAFWRGELEEGPLMWVTAANAKAGPLIPEPTSEEELWTNVDYVIASTEASLARTHFAGDALPVFCPWLGPDQFAGWLGAELILKPHAFTSWAKPFVNDWDDSSGVSHRSRQPVVEALPGHSPGIRARRPEQVGDGLSRSAHGRGCFERDSRPGPPGAGPGREPGARPSRDAADDCAMEMGGGYRLGDHPAGWSRHNQLDDGLEQPAFSVHRPE